MMIDAQNDTAKLIQNRVSSPQSKENTVIPLMLTSSTTFAKPSHAQPQQPPPQRILQTHFLNLTTNQPKMNKVASPKSSNASGPVVGLKQVRIIELGGSKQKKMSKQRNSSINETQTQRNELSATETLSRRVAMLQSRVKQLHMQKQQLAIDLNQKNKILQAENLKLNTIIKDLQSKKATDTNIPTPRGEKANEFDLQQMLAHQININLQLREELENVNRSFQAHKNNYSLQKNELNTASEENVGLKLQFVQLQDSSQDEIHRLKEEIGNLQENLSRNQSSTIKMIQERQKRILELQEQNYTLNSKLSQQHAEKQALNLQLQSLNSELKSQKDEFLSLKSRVEQLQKPLECKKCKQLLHTVFRLNSQLNRK